MLAYGLNAGRHSHSTTMPMRVKLAGVKCQGIRTVAAEIPIQRKQYVHADVRELVFIAMPEVIQFSGRGGIINTASHWNVTNQGMIPDRFRQATPEIDNCDRFLIADKVVRLERFINIIGSSY